jgi:hypothetical protein
VFVVDCSTNAVVDTIDLSWQPLALHWYGPLDKLYVECDSGVVAVDCSTRTVTGVIPTDRRQYATGVFSERNDKFWTSTNSSTWVIDCRADTVVAIFPGGTYNTALEWNSIENQVYVAYGNLLSIYRDEIVGLEAVARDVPVRFSLRPVSNPAPGAVRFDCGLPGRMPGRLRVYDAMGRQVWSEAVAAGSRTVVWPGCDRQGRRLAAGVYLARLESGRSQATAKVVLR